jgi:RNA polymerase sigma-70 factor (ECF subfamily)
MTAASSVRAEMLKSIPSLRAFAISLCGNIDGADDLVQETLVKAWGNIDSFTEGSNMAAWLFTILRNVFYSQYRKRRREVDDPEGQYAAKLATAPDQHSHMEFMDLKTALQKLPPDQREALILVGASGLSYEDAATICGCAIGTMKSRVNRARGRLAELLMLAPGDSFGGDPRWDAAIDSQMLAMHE